MSLTKRGRFWHFDFWFKKKRHQGTTGCANHEKAKTWLNAYRTNLAMKGVGLIEKEPAPILSVFLRGDFLKSIEQNAKTEGTKKTYRKKIDVLCRFPLFTKKTLEEITELEIQAFKESRLLAKIAVATINGDLRVLRKALRFADTCGLIRYRMVHTLPGETHRVFVVSSELEKEYLEAAPYPLKQVAILMLDLGLRPEECVALRKGDVTVTAVTITSGKTANARRVLPQTERTREVFKLCFELWPDSPWVFPGRKPGRHLTRNRVSMCHVELRNRINETAAETIRNDASRAAIVTDSRMTAFPAEFLLYSLRHTFATRFAESVNGDTFLLMKALGHADPKICAKYVHPTADYLSLAMKRKEQFDKIVRGEVMHEQPPTEESAHRSR